MLAIIVTLLLTVLTVLFVIFIYNKLVRLRNMVEEGLSFFAEALKMHPPFTRINRRGSQCPQKRYTATFCQDLG